MSISHFVHIQLAHLPPVEILNFQYSVYFDCIFMLICIVFVVCYANLRYFLWKQGL